MRRWFCCLLVGLAWLSVAQAKVHAQMGPKKPEIHNDSPKKFWIHRRDPADPDPKGSLAVVMNVSVTGDTVVAKIWRYTGYNAAGRKYTNRTPVLIATGSSTANSPVDTRKLERVTLSSSEGDIYLALFKGSRTPKGNGRAQQRLLVRWKQAGGKDGAQQCDGMEVTLVCDEPPNEDVLEEEPLPDEEPPPELPDP